MNAKLVKGCYPFCHSVFHICTLCSHQLLHGPCLPALKPPIYPALFPEFERRNIFTFFLLESLLVGKCLWFMIGDQFNKLSYAVRFSVQLFSSSLSSSGPRLFICYWLSLFCFQIWRVEERDLIPWEQNLHGMFFSGDSYVIKYNYTANWKRRIIIYFWQVKLGSGCTQMHNTETSNQARQKNT